MNSRTIALILALALEGATIGSTARVVAQGTRVPAVDRLGDALPPGALARLGTERLRHDYRILGVAFSPDGKTLASISYGDFVRVWDRTTGKRLLDLGDAMEGALSLAYSPDGRKLATGDGKGNVILWDVKTGKVVFKKKGHAERVLALAFSPDGANLAAAGENVCVWDATTGAEIHYFPPPPRTRSGDSQGVAFSPDGKLLAGSFRDQIHIWDVGRRTRQTVIPKAHIPIVMSLVFSDNRTLISGGHSAVRTWDVATGKQVRELKAESGYGGSLALSGDGKLLSAAYWNKIRLWNNRTGESIRVMADYGNTFGTRAHQVDISRDGATLAAGAEDSVVHVWDVASGKRILEFPESHSDRVRSAAYSPDGRHVLTGGDGSVRLWDVSTSKQVRSYSFGDLNCFGVVAAFSPDGKTIAAGSYDNSLKQQFAGSCRVWDAVTGKELRIQSFPHRVTRLAFSPDGKTLALDSFDTNAMGDSHTIFLWDISTGKEPVPLTTDPGDVSWLSFLPNGKTLATIQNDRLGLWDVATKKRCANSLLAGLSLQSAVFSADGKVVVTSESEGDWLVAWDAASGEMLRRMEMKNTLGSNLALSFDGRILASAPISVTSADREFDRSIHLWEMSTGRKIATIPPGNSRVTTLAFAPGARTLISGMENGTALIWNVKQQSAQALSPKDMERLWRDLAGADTGQAYAAIGTLAAVPDKSVPFLKGRLLPRPEVPVARVRALIAQLGSDDFTARQKATKELEKLEGKPTGYLREALAKDPTLEVRRRIESLLTAARRAPSAQLVQHLRAIQVLEDVGSDAARRVLNALAKELPPTRETDDAKAALDRLGRDR